MEICGSPQLIDMITIYHLITNEIDSKNKFPPKNKSTWFEKYAMLTKVTSTQQLWQ